MSDFIITNNILEKYTGADCDVVIPDGIKVIGSRAFYRCKNLQSIVIPEGVEYVGSEAFRDCKNLQSVTIPKSVKEIGESAFNPCEKLTISCSKNSTAAKYAKKLKIPFEIISLREIYGRVHH